MQERRRKVLFNEIIGEILHYIEANNMKNGDKFPPEKKLAEILKISRLTLREALKALEALRVIEIRHGVGIFLRDSKIESSFDTLLYKLFSIHGLTRKEFEDILEARSMIESITILMAVEKIKDSNLRKLKSMLDTMELNLEKGINNQEIDTSFHMEIAIASENFVLTRIIKTIETLIGGIRYTYLSKKSRALRSHKQHVDIYKALKDRNKELAAKLMSDHLKNVGDEFIEYIIKK